MRKIFFYFPILLMLVFFASCSHFSTTNQINPSTQIIESTDTSTYTPFASNTSVPIIENTPTITVSPTQTSLPFSKPVEPIKIDAITHLSSMTQWTVDYVSDLKFSPDGSFFAVRSSKVLLYDIASFQLIGEFSTENSIYCFAISPDSQTMATGEKDGTITLWDINSKTKVSTFFSNLGSVYALAFSPDGDYLASGIRQTILLWDLSSGKEIARLSGHNSEVSTLFFTKNGQSLISAEIFSKIIYWNVSRAEENKKIDANFTVIRNFSVSPSGEFFSTGFADNESYGVMEINAINGQKSKLFRGHTRNILDTAYSTDGSIIASSSYDQTIILWNRHTGKSIFTLSDFKDDVTSVDFSPDGLYLAAGSSDGTIIIYSIDKTTTITPIPTETASVTPTHTLTSVNTPTPQNTSFPLTTSINVNNAANLKLWRTLPISDTNQISFTADGKYLIAGYENRYHLWDYKKGIEISHFGDAYNGYFAVSPDSRYLMGEFEVYRLSTGELIHNLITDFGYESCSGPPVFSGNGQYAACIGTNIFLWNAQTWELMFKTETNHKFYDNVLISDDGTRLIASLNSGGFQIWDIPMQTMTVESQDTIIPLFFSSDGKDIWMLSDPLDGYRNAVVKWQQDGLSTIPGLKISYSGFALMKSGATIYLYDNGQKDAPLFACMLGKCPTPEWMELTTPNLIMPALSPDLLILAGRGSSEGVQLWAIDNADK